MESSEGMFGATAVEVPPTAPPQSEIPYSEKIDISEKLPTSDHAVHQDMNMGEGVKGMEVDDNEDMEVGGMEEEREVAKQNPYNTCSPVQVNNKEDSGYHMDTPATGSPAKLPQYVQSPAKEHLPSSPLHNNLSSTTSVPDEVEPVNCEEESAPEPEPSADTTDKAAEPDVEMSEDLPQQPSDTKPSQPDAGVVNNDGHGVSEEEEDEMKVEEVEGGGQEDTENKVEESSAVPVVEEPDTVDEEQQLAEDKMDDNPEDVQIKDVTEKDDELPPAEELEEEKKSAEELLIEHINTVSQCFDDFIKTKDEVKIKDCMSLLTEIKSLAEKTVDSLKAFTAAQKDVEKGHGSKKGKRSKSSTKQGKGSTKAEKNDVGGESDNLDPLEEVNLKEIKGLAVFAKWPNSGWFYPGVVRNLVLADWKTSQNVTVTFYDGLERQMKTINIFPAELIPTSSVLFDLDDETDMVVTTVEREGTWVKYLLNSPGVPNVTKDFDKLAIKGTHMKTIKQSVDSAGIPDSATKSEPIVSGRRARGKSSLFNEDYVSSSSPRSSEKRKADSKSTTAKTPAKRKSNSKDDEGESTPSRSASKRRQVNGTKSTPRRAAKK